MLAALGQPLVVLFSLLMNQLLLCPYQVQLQHQALTFLRRFYHRYPQFHPQMAKPINVLFSNLALFTSSPADQKEGAQWLSTLLQSADADLVALLEKNPHLHFLKESADF